MKTKIFLFVFINIIYSANYAQNILISDFIRDYKTKGNGIKYQFYDTDSTKNKTSVLIDFYFSKKVIKRFNNLELENKIINNYIHEKNILSTNKYLKDRFRFCIRDISLNMDESSKSFMSEDTLKLLFMNNKNELFEEKCIGIFELKKIDNDICFDIVFVTKNNWYYFSYNNIALRTFSSDKVFVNLVYNEKSGRRKIKNSNYFYSASPESVIKKLISKSYKLGVLKEIRIKED